MTLPAGAAIHTKDSVQNVDVNGAATALLADGAVDAEASKTVISSVAPFTDLTLICQVPTTTAAGASVHIYRRDLAVDGTNDASIPTTNNKQEYVGSIMLPTGMTINTDYYIKKSAFPLNPTGDCEFYIENDAGFQLNAGWQLLASIWSYNAQG